MLIDSGLGGLTVAAAVRRLLPHEHLVYFGDTARLPYGSKSPATVAEFVRQIIAYLRPLDPKHVVIACNTATALALPAARAAFSGLSISGVIEPGARAAVAAAGAKDPPVIGVIATEATVRSRAYDRAILRRRSRARVLLRPTPLLVPLIEEGRSLSDPVTRLALQQYLKPMLERNIDVLLLGCTHYPLLKGPICEVVGPSVVVIDSAEQTAEDVARRLRACGLLRPGNGPATFSCFVTDHSERFAKLAERFVGWELEPPQWVEPNDLHQAGQATASSVRAAG